jgi:hypothetical protein
MVYKINLRFRRFSSGKGQIIGLSVSYIAPRPKDARRGSSVSRAHDLTKGGELLGSATISPSTITMDHNAIICFINDRLARGPDAYVHVPSVVGPKYPSRGVDALYL